MSCNGNYNTIIINQFKNNVSIEMYFLKSKTKNVSKNNLSKTLKKAMCTFKAMKSVVIRFEC